MDSNSDIGRLTSDTTFHCYNCGFILLRKSVDHMGIVGAKCTNAKCRQVNYFIFTKGRFRLLTHKFLDLIDEKELLPYTKSDILKLVVK